MAIGLGGPALAASGRPAGVKVRVHIFELAILGRAIEEAVEALGLPIVFSPDINGADIITVPLLPRMWRAPDRIIRPKPAPVHLERLRAMNCGRKLVSQYWLMECLREGCFLPVEPWDVAEDPDDSPSPCSAHQDQEADREEYQAEAEAEAGRRFQQLVWDEEFDVKPSNQQLAQRLRPSDAGTACLERGRSRRPTTPSVIIGRCLSEAERARYRNMEPETVASTITERVSPISDPFGSSSTPCSSNKRRKVQHQNDMLDEKVPIDMTPPPLPTRPWSRMPSQDTEVSATVADSITNNVKKKRDKPKFAWPAYSERPVEEKWSIYQYFLDYAQTHLPEELRDMSDPDHTSYEMDDTTGARIAAIEKVPAEHTNQIIQVWAEAKRRYTRRNLDHMSIMLSTWTTCRRLNLAPTALRAFYKKHNSRIRSLAGPYVPMQVRPAGFPWHEGDPIDPEGLIEWIPDWGQPDCAAFMGWDGAEDDVDD